MEVLINNLFCHKDMTLNIEPGATLVTGKNASGKTSIAKILAALLSHDANPLHISAAQAKKYVMDGETEGSASIDDVQWKPGAGIIAAEGSKPQASRHSVGLVDFVSPMSAKARAEIWEPLFLPSDARAILEPEWTGGTNELESVLTIIGDEGDWQRAEKIYTDKRAQAKGEWQHITGETYGLKKASTWTPKGWRSELEDASREELENTVHDLRQAVDDFKAIETINAHEIEKAQKARDVSIPATENALEIHNKTAAEWLERYEETRTRIQAIEAEILKIKANRDRAKALLAAEPAHKCPQCQAGLSLDGKGFGTDVRIKLWAPPDPERVQKAQSYLDGAPSAIEKREFNLQSEKETWQAQTENLEKERAEATKCKVKLDELKRIAKDADKEVTSFDAAKANEASVAHDDAVKDLSIWHTWREAHRQDALVRNLDSMCTLLGPKGARMRKVGDAMEAIRKLLVSVTKITGWKPVSLSDDYSVTVDGRPVQMCSESERLKAQWALQFVSCLMTKSKYLVLDQADTLRDESWDGLVKLISTLCEKRPHIAAIVCATSTPSIGGWDMVNLNDEGDST